MSRTVTFVSHLSSGTAFFDRTRPLNLEEYAFRYMSKSYGKINEKKINRFEWVKTFLYPGRQYVYCGAPSLQGTSKEARLPENLEGQFSCLHRTTQRQVGTPALIIYFPGKVRNIKTNCEPRNKQFGFQSLNKQQKELNR